MQVSIIIPVYNVASTLKKALDSVMTQSFRDWEAICIDDGSTDSSGMILDEYSVLDARIRVVHQNNSGVSSARQRALEMAKGEWIASIDPDDYVQEGYLNHLVAIAAYTSADVIWTDYYEDKGGITKRISQEYDTTPGKFAEGLLTCTLWGAMWNKLIRKDFIVQSAAKFPEIRLYAKEDLCFLAQILAANPRMYYLNMSDYHYVIHPRSTIHRRNLDVFETDRYVQLCLEKCFSEFGLESLLHTRRMQCKCDWYSLPTVTNRQFYETFPEVTNICSMKIKLVHKILYWIASHGARSLVVRVFKVIRAVKV